MLRNASSVSFFEKHVSDAGQSFQADYDAPSGDEKEICARVALLHVRTGRRSYLDFSGVANETETARCLPLATKLQPFHNPAGYDPCAW